MLSRKSGQIAVIGIDIGKNFSHVVGLDKRGAIVLRQKWSRGQVEVRSASREVGSRGITVNNIQPGPIDTDLNPAAGDWAVPQKANTALDRYGSVDEVAALVAFVAGPEASYITGANLTVDGGTNA